MTVVDYANLFNRIPHQITITVHDGHRCVSLAAVDRCHRKPEGSARWILCKHQRGFGNRGIFGLGDGGLTTTGDDSNIFLTAPAYMRLIGFWDDDISWDNWTYILDNFLTLGDGGDR
jgi:hypothetical protein